MDKPNEKGKIKVSEIIIIRDKETKKPLTKIHKPKIKKGVN